jgi:hypothetical protein
MVHDMALTRNHAIFFDFPLWNFSKAVSVEDESRFGVVSRDGSSSVDRRIQWFASGGQWGYHTVNAWEVETSSQQGGSSGSSTDSGNGSSTGDGNDTGSSGSGHSVQHGGKGVQIELLTCSSRSFMFSRSNADSLFLHRWRFDMDSGQTVER